jgi:primosomal protein N' (replication factor Y)
LSEEDAALVAEVSLFPAVPLSIQRVANVERAQMLLECPSRKALHKTLEILQHVLHESRSAPEHKGLIRWLVDVDPLAI